MYNKPFPRERRQETWRQDDLLQSGDGEVAICKVTHPPLPPHVSFSLDRSQKFFCQTEKKKEKHCTISLLDGVSALIDATDCCCCSDYSEVIMNKCSVTPPQ